MGSRGSATPHRIPDRSSTAVDVSPPLDEHALIGIRDRSGERVSPREEREGVFMHRRRYLLFLGLLTLLLGMVWTAPTPASADSTIVKMAKGKIKRPAIVLPDGTRKLVPAISSGTMAAATTPTEPELDDPDIRADNGAKAGVTIQTNGCANRSSAGNVRVNQDCTFRRQAEELIKANPIDSRNLIAGQNDSRVGFNKCGFDYSFDGGRHWGDGLPPFYQHENGPVAGHTIAGGPGTGHTYDAASDPAVAFDSQGRAFFSCVLFDINSNASAVFVTASVPGAGGSFYNNVPASGSSFVAVEDNAAEIAHDKNFITADANPNSPNRDNVYLTWTVFKFGTTCGAPPDGTLQFCSNAIFGTMSTDHAVTWSQPEEISGRSSLCSFGNFFDPSRNANDCDLDQGSDPVVLPNGNLVAVFNNGNTTTANGQQLSVTCRPSGKSEAGTAHLNCANPAKVGDDVVVGQPLCDFGRGPEECIPGSFIRTNDFPRLAVDSANGELVAAWQDFRGGEFDVQVSRSTDGGATWTTAARAANPDAGAGFDHYMPAVDVVAGSSSRFGVSYYRTAQVPGERNGTAVFAPGQPGVQATASQMFLAGGSNTPLTARTISPTFPPPAGNQAGFNGDYSGLVIVGDTAHPVWSDTRNTAPAGQVATTPAAEEDIFTDAIDLPGR